MLRLLAGPAVLMAVGSTAIVGQSLGSDTTAQQQTTQRQVPVSPNSTGTDWSTQQYGSQDGTYNGANQNRNGQAPGQTNGQAPGQRQQNGFGDQGVGDYLTFPPDKPTEFQQLVLVTTGRRLPIFGASLFSRVPSTFAPVDDVPVTPDYVIGPGDQLRLQVWGQVNQQGSFTVDRTGSIAIPGVGTVHVAGVRFADLAGFLRSQLGRVYRNFELNVNLGQLRSIQVFVVGAARRPGSYTIGSLSTLLNALFASGGPKPEGSLRDIQVRRGSEVVTHFDLYDLLLHGDKSKDVPLQPGDVIFIPTVGPQVALAGSVNNPAIYELKADLQGGTTIGQLLELGGGRTSVAAGSSVRLERISEHVARTILDVDLSKAADTVLQNGDVVTVTPIVDRFKDAVTLRGNVANPGRYVWHPGMRVGDLFPTKDALVTRNYWRKRDELGQLSSEYEPNPVPTMSEGVLQVQRGGVNSNTRSSGQTDMSGAGSNGGSNNANGSTASGNGNAGNNSAGNNNNNYSNNGDASTRRDAETQRGSLSDSGGGSVGVALTGTNGVFEAKNDVVLSAPDIDWSYAVIERQSAADLTTSLLSFNLGKVVLEGDASQNLPLMPGDVVTIFSTADLRVPTVQQTRFVRLEGEFNASGVYSVRPGETLRQLLIRAGGFTPDAYLYASEFTRESTRRVERQRLNEYADQLEAQIAAASSGAASRAVSGQDAVATAASADEAKLAVARLRRREPIGRIVLDLKPNSQGAESVPDLTLEDGDRFVVPRVPSNVNVAGQVYSANAFVFQPHRRVKDYLKQAGGPDRQADRRRAFVLRADGSVLSRQYGNFERAQLFPGDTIVVPPVLDRRSILRTIVDLASIAGQIGFAAAAINVVR